MASQPGTYHVHFPKAGMNTVCPFARQPNRPVGPDQEHARTTPLGVNVRAFDTLSSRIRGGSRPGHEKLIATQINGDWIAQELNTIVGTFDELAGGGVQTSQSGRVVRLVGVSNGVVKVWESGDAAWTAVTNNTGNTPALNASGVMQSAASLQKLYFADGAHWVYYDPATNSLETWTAGSGTLPVDGIGNKPRLITNWFGRIVLSGLLEDPHNWFMSAVNSPINFNYSPASPSSAQAVAGNNSDMGEIGDVVTALIPFNDDILIFGGDHSLYAMRGNPAAGGSIDKVSSEVGVAWGKAWCQDPFGAIYFLSNRCGVYRWMPTGGSLPERISQPIEPLLQALDMGSSIHRLQWNDARQEFNLYVTEAAAAAETHHFVWEQRTGGWGKDVFANNDHNPLCCVVFDGSDPGDRRALIGGWDGYVRVVSDAAVDDDGYDIDSEVWILLATSPTLDDIMVRELQAVLATGSGDVTWEVYEGETAEAAFDETANSGTGVWEAGRNPTDYVRVANHAVYVRITSSNRWAMEEVRAVLEARGLVRQRRAS